MSTGTDTGTYIGTKTTKMEGIRLGPFDGCFPVYTERERFLMDIERERCEARHNEEKWVEVAVYLVVFTLVSVLFSVVGSRYYVRNYGIPEEHKRLARMERELVVQGRELAAQGRELAGERKKAREMQDFYHGKQSRDYSAYGYNNGAGGGEGTLDKRKQEKAAAEDTKARREFEGKQLELLEDVRSELRDAAWYRIYDK